MSYETDRQMPPQRDVHIVERRSDNGPLWFIVGALVVAIAVVALVVMEFGAPSGDTADTGTSVTLTEPATAPAVAPEPTRSAEPASPATGETIEAPSGAPPTAPALAPAP